jgi:hypothetical protein
MTATLSELFQKSNGQPITAPGKLIHSICTQTVKAGSTLKITRISHSHEVVQGLRVTCDNGELEINGQMLVDIILWVDTSPVGVDIKVVANSDTTLKFWNAWRFKGITQAWVGNAGICIEENEGRVRLMCSDGVGEPDFEDLVVDIVFAKP